MLFILFIFLQQVNGHQPENELDNWKQHKFENRQNDFNEIDEIENQKDFIRNKRKRNRGNRNQFDDGPYVRDESLNKPCNKPNTHINFAGQCVCNKGYQTTDVYEIGCWKCHEQCHINAQCESDGKCKCFSGYRGDGIKTCDLMPPIIKSVIPTEIYEKDLSPYFRVNVSYSYLNYVSNEAFCSFGSRVVKTQIIQNGVLPCPVPMGLKGKVPLHISFNNKEWSEEEVDFTIIGNKFEFEIVSVYFLIFAILFALARAAYIQYKEMNKPGRMSNKTLKLARRRRRGL